MAVSTNQCQWALSRGHGRNSSSFGSSSSDDSQSVRFEMDEELGVYLVVNGERARSKRTKEQYKQLVGVKRVEDKMEFTTEDGRVICMQVANADMTSISQDFPSVCMETLEESIQPLLSSTPMRPRMPLQESRRKRLKVLGSSQNSTQNHDGKFKGVVEVPLNSIKRAANGLTLVEPSHARIEAFKKTLTKNQRIHLPVLPVMVDGDSWEQENPEKATYILLGGYSLWEALLDVSSDEKYQCYRHVLVKVHEGLTAMEALHVGAVFQQEQSLLMDDAPTLKAKVAICRRILYATHDRDETDEPPSSVKLEWRPQAAAALGFAASTRKELKPLEATFQLALYSKRCYEKLVRVFDWYEEEHGKAMKQSMFVLLQGLKEEEKFNILTRLVNGDMKLEDVKLETWRMKRQATIRHMFVSLTNKDSWEECCRDFPAHTVAPALEHFLNMDFKKAVPIEFVEYVREAQNTFKRGSSSFEHLSMDPVALTVIQMESHEARSIRRVLQLLKTGSKTVAILAQGVECASAWCSEMRKQGYSLLGETAIIKETSVRHLITAATNKEGRSQPPTILQDAEMYGKLIQLFSKQGEYVGCATGTQELCEIAVSMGRQVRRISTGRERNSSGSSSNPSEFDFSDSDATELDL